MERQINLAADNGWRSFLSAGIGTTAKARSNVKAIEDDSKHLPMRLFMEAKNNNRMEFCLMVANQPRV